MVVLELMRPKESGQVGNLLKFPEKTAGRIMNPNVFALSEDLTVGEGISQLQSSRDVEMVFYVYSVDGAGIWSASSRCGACCGVARDAAEGHHGRTS